MTLLELTICSAFNFTSMMTCYSLYPSIVYIWASPLCSLEQGICYIGLRYNQVLFHSIYCNFCRAQEFCSLYQGIHYNRVRLYMKFILYLASYSADADLPNDLLCNLITRHIYRLIKSAALTVYMYVAHMKQHTS